MPIWKYSMCILARNFDFSNLCTEKCPSFDLKRGTFYHLRDEGIFVYQMIKTKLSYSTFSESADMSRHKKIENR